SSTLFPYTTRFRSGADRGRVLAGLEDGDAFEVALLADGELERALEPGGVDDGRVRAVRLGACEAGLDVVGGGAVAALAGDAERQLGVVVLREGGVLGEAVVARHALERGGAAEAAVRGLVAGTHVPERALDVPCQRHLGDETARAHEVRARRVAAAHHVIGRVGELVRDLSAPVEAVLALEER